MTKILAFNGNFNRGRNKWQCTNCNFIWKSNQDFEDECTNCGANWLAIDILEYNKEG